MVRRITITAILQVVCLCAAASSSSAFVVRPQPQIAAPTTRPLNSKKATGGDDVVQQKSFSVGTFVEFQEKKRIHVGKIETVELKSNGGARYEVVDSEGRKFGIPDKDVLYAMPCPSTPGKADKLFDEFCQAQDAPAVSLQEQLDISPDLLQMAWEEVAADDDADSDHLMTADSLIDLVHSHAASSMERYLAWKLLKTDMAHVFFKEIKDRGRVVAFKAKPGKSVEAAKQVFCKTHEDSEICFV